MELDKILNKLGLYDLIAVLLPGVSITAFAVLTLDIIWDIDINKTLDFTNTIILLTVGYLIGLIFQEIGSDAYRYLFKIKKNSLDEILHSTQKGDDTLSSRRAEEITAFVEKKFANVSIDDEDIYDYCKFCVFKQHDHFFFDKDQSLSAMSRSFACYFLISALSTLINVVLAPNIINMAFTFFSFFVAFLMYKRSIRFAKIRFKNIFKAFYLENIYSLDLEDI